MVTLLLMKIVIMDFLSLKIICQKEKKRKIEEKKNVNRKPTQKSNSLEGENCGSKFTRKDNLARHMKKKH